MLTCRDVVDLVATDAWKQPPWTRRLAIHLHLAMCRHCRAYVRQLQRLGAAARLLFEGRPVGSEQGDRIAKAVREAAEAAGPQPGADSG